MFAWAMTFLLLSIVAAYLGFFGLGGFAAGIVQVLFVVCLILLGASALASLMQDEPPL